MPDGYLLFSGYNPISSAGLMKLWPGVKQQLPWAGRFFYPIPGQGLAAFTWSLK